MTTTFPTHLARSFPDLPETEEETNGKRGRCGSKETAADRCDKGPRTVSTTPHLENGHEGEKSCVRFSAKQHTTFPREPTRHRVETAVRLSRCSRGKQGRLLPSPSPMTHWRPASSLWRPEPPVEPGAWRRAGHRASGQTAICTPSPERPSPVLLALTLCIY